MAHSSWRRWLGQLFGTTTKARVSGPERARLSRFRPLVEQMEDRVTPAVTSAVAAGVLTINGTFNDSFFVTSQGGQVKINGMDPGSGAALSNTIIQINVNPGPGENLVDLRSVLPASFTSLVNFNINGGAGVDTYKVNPSFPGTIQSGNQPNLLIFEGTATDVVENLITDRVIADGVTINVPGDNASLRINLNMQNFTLNPGPGNHRILADDPTPNDGISRAFNASDGSFSDFKNPFGTLTVRDINAAGNGSIYEFNALDALRRPANVVLDVNNRTDTVRFTGSATDVVADYVNDVVFLDGQIVQTPNSGPANFQFFINTDNFTLAPGAGNHRIVRDDGIANNGISRLFNNNDGSFTDIFNPNNSLTIKNITGSSSGIFEFNSIDAVGTPSIISLDVGTGGGQQRFTGTYANVVENLVDGFVSLDGFIVAIPGSGPSTLLIDVAMENFTIQPGSNNHRILRDDPTPNNGISRAFNNSDGTFSDFRNPSNSVTVQNINATSGSIYEFRTLDAVNRPAIINLDVGDGGGQQRFTGTYTNVVENLVNLTVSLDGLVVNIPGNGPSTLLIDANMVNFTIQPGANNHRILQDDGVANNGISRAFNATDNTFSDFRNPTNSVTVQNINPTSGSIYEFRALDSLNPPPNVTLDVGNGGGQQRFTGTYTNVVENLVNLTVSLDGRVVNIPGDGPSTLLIDANMVNFTLQPSANNHRILRDDPTPNNGISRAFNNSNGTFSDFRNPSGTLTVQNTSMTSGSIYEFQGLDGVRPPAQVNLDVGDGGGQQRFTGTFRDVVEDLVNLVVTLDGQKVGIPGDGPSTLLIDAQMVNFTLQPSANNHRILRDNGVAGDGISRAFNNTDNTFSDFRNPSGKLTVQNKTNSGGAIFEFNSLDVVGRPMAIDLDVGAAGGQQRFTGTYTSVIENLVDLNVSLDGLIVGIPGDGPSTLLIDAVMRDFIIQPSANNHRILQDDPTPNNGISRAFNNSDGTFSDFRNPTNSVTVQNINNSNGSIYEFRSLDAQNPPPVINLDVGDGGGEQRFTGTFANVIEDLVNSTVSLNGRIVNIIGDGPSTLLLDIAMTNFTLLPGPGNHRILQDDPTPNDGISRAFNNSDGTFSDFRNPTGTLTVRDSNSVGGSIYEFQTLDVANRPVNIVLDTAANAGLQVISVPGQVTNVVEDLVNDRVTVDGLVIGIPGSGPSNVFLNMQMENLTIQPGASNHRILQDNGTPNDGISRAFNASNITFSDFRNPSGRLTIQNTSMAGGSIYEFQNLDAAGRPEHIVLDLNNRPGTLRFTGTATNVTEDLVGDVVIVDSLVIETPNSGPANLQMFVNTVNFTLIIGAGNNRVLRDNGIANDGISRAFNNDDGTFSDFKNPTGTLTVRASGGATTINVQGLDASGQPANVELVGAAGNDTFLVDFTAGLVIPDKITVQGNQGQNTLRVIGSPRPVQKQRTTGGKVKGVKAGRVQINIPLKDVGTVRGR